MAAQGEDVYATLLMNDGYLPGAVVLAHSLRDNGTTKKLAALITADNLSHRAIDELRSIYDYVIPVERVVNPTQANLYLMNRPDLHSTFTKITLWKQTQFRRIVYMDADMVALRAPDELFDLAQPFSAAPDIGWPDLFNTGLMVLTPNLGDYYGLLAMAERGISFDGADQGLLNMHFKNSYNRLSFLYNVTPSAHYQYIPAYKHFQSGISAVHFIGKEKPWTQGRDAQTGSKPYDEVVGRWWAVYDRHYRAQTAVMSGQGEPSIVVQHVRGEWQPPAYGYSSSSAYVPPPAGSPPQQAQQPASGSDERAEQWRGSFSQEQPAQDQSQAAQQQPTQVTFADTRVPAIERKPAFEAPFSSWDPSKAPPPAEAGPEAMNFPSSHYEMSHDPAPFKAPAKYPEPPKNMWYDVPKTPTYQKPRPIFPWEVVPSKPTRVFPGEEEYDRRLSVEGLGSPQEALSPTDKAPDGVTMRPTDALEKGTEPAVRDFAHEGSEQSPERTESDEASAPTTPGAPVEPWETFTLRNAWDAIPEIERYISSLQKNRKGNIQVLQGYGAGVAQNANRRSSIITDFPTEVERPSLPVTPAPMRRPSFWGSERDDEGDLPAADGVPNQEEWDPVAQLEALARRQSEVLNSKLQVDPQEAGKDIPQRPLPYGSEGVTSPTYNPLGPPGRGGAAAGFASFAGFGKEEVISPGGTKRFVERGVNTDRPHVTERGINTDESRVAESKRVLTSGKDQPLSSTEIEEPSFQGPGAMFEKDELNVPEHGERGLRPSEEELDVLQGE